MNSPITRRATSVSIASSVGQLERRRRRLARARSRSCAAVQLARGALAGDPEPDRLRRRLRRMQVEARPRRRARRSCRPPGRPARRPAARSSRTCSSSRSSRSRGSAIRSRRTSASATVDHEQALVVERRAEDRSAVRRDDLRAAPERDRLVHPDAVAEDDERGRQLGVGPHQRPPRGRRPEPDLVRGREVAARRRRDVDQDLGPVEGQDLGHRQVPEVLADRDPEPDARAATGTARSMSPGGEEAALVEQAVGRQEELAVDVPDLAVLEQGGRDEQPVVGRLLDERDDRRQAAGRAPPSSARRGSSSRIATSAARSWSR